MQKAAGMIVDEQDGKKIDVAEFSELNTAFHDIICDSAQSTYLSKILGIVRLRFCVSPLFPGRQNSPDSRIGKNIRI